MIRTKWRSAENYWDADYDNISFTQHNPPNDIDLVLGDGSANGNVAGFAKYNLGSISL